MARADPHDDYLYNHRPEERKKRVKRVLARRAYEKEHGDLPRNMEIDHKKPLRDGGTNAPSNLRVVPRSKNRPWNKGK